MSKNIILGKSFGNRENGGYVKYNPDHDKTVNPHILIAGTSGAGKTILIKSLIGDLNSAGKTIVVFDLHGDMKTDGENLIEYTPRDTQFGINPFEFDCDLKYGGPNARSRMIIEMFKNNFWPNMGTLQETILENLLIDTYAENGIFDERPETWPFTDNESFPENVGLSKEEAYSLRGGKEETKLPNMESLRIVYEKVLSYVKNGSTHSYFTLIKESFKTKEKFLNAQSDSSREKYRSKLMLEINSLEKIAKDYLAFLRTEDEEKYNVQEHINFEKYNNPQAIRVLENLGEYIKKFANMNIFIKNKPTLIKGINRIDLQGFTNEAKPEFALFFINLSIERIFRKCKMRGDYTAYAKRKGIDQKLDMYIVLDESRLVLPTGKERTNPFNMFNRIALESRKYGLGMILGSQRISHYNDELLATIFTKIILKTDDTDVPETLKKLNLKGTDYLSTVNQNPGTGMIIQTGERIKLTKLNSWMHIKDGQPYLTEENIAA